MGTIAGYFSDPGKLVEWAARLSAGFRNRKGEAVKVSSVYVTLNPLNPALLARCAERCQPYARNTASDTDVLNRYWLGLDFDPVRPAGVSSTDAEHEAAIESARRVREWLRGMGWPEPVLADSGNGGHLLYRVNLPNTPEATELVRRVVDAVAAFHSGGGVEVDRRVYNAARVWKVYGTLAAKGDDLPERPHRLARLLEVPEALEMVPREALESVAALAPQPEVGGFRGGANAAGFDVGEWLRAHGVEIRSEKPWNGGRLWVLRRCPWNPEHANLSAFVFQDAAGRVTAKCHHNSCSGKGWVDLRDAVEGPGWRESRRLPDSSASSFYLDGPIYAPENWKVLCICRDWREARHLAAQGNAVVVARKDGSLPPGAAKLVAEAREIKTVGFTQEEAQNLAWALYPLRVMRQASVATSGTALDPAPASEPVTEASAAGLVQETPGGTRVPPVIPEPPPEQDDISPFGFALSDLSEVVDAGPGSPADSPGQVGDAAAEDVGKPAKVGQYPFDPATEAYLLEMRSRCLRLGQ
ncbi:MAG: hypothetical protein AB1776_08640, partial [Bacillota bacterium]